MNGEEENTFTTYKVFYKNKQVKEVTALTRLLAVKSAKKWFYDRVACNKMEGKARMVLRVSDPNKECNYYGGLNTKLDQNNYLLKEDCERILSQSKGILRLATKSEQEKAGEKIGRITQFITLKRHRYPVKKVNGIPFLYKQNNTFFYYITAQRQKTIGTEWRKGSRNNKKSPRWEGDGRKVWDSKSLKEKPTCAKKGKIVRKYKPKLIKLHSKDIESAISEILQRNLYKIDKSINSKKKIEKLKEVSLKIRFKKFLDFFPCLKNYKLCPVLKEGMKLLNNRVLYNAEWVDARLNGDKSKLFQITRDYIRTRL